MAITSPLDISGCVLWLAAGHVGIGAGPATLPNLAGGSVGVKNGTVNCTNNGSGGTPCLEFTGGSWYAFTGLMTGAAAGEVRYTIKSAATDASYSKWGTESQDAWLTNSGQWYEHYGRNTRPAFACTAADYKVWHRLGVRSGPGVWEGERNGVTIWSSPGSGAVAWNATTQIGSTYGGGYAGVSYGCIVGFNRILTTGERTDLDNWMIANPQGGTPNLAGKQVPYPIRVSAGNTEAFIWWETLAGASSYEYRLNGGSAVANASTFARATGLTNGVPYTVEVRPLSSGGNGDWSSHSAIVTPTSGSAVYLLDDYNRADSATVPGTPTVGTYTVRSGTVGILSNQMYAPANAIMTFPAAIDCDMTIETRSLGWTGGSGIIAHWVDASNFWAFLYNELNQLTIYRNLAGSFNAFSPTNEVPTAYQNGRLRVRHRDAKFHVFINEKLVFAMDNLFFSQATIQWGYRTQSTNFRVENAWAASPIPLATSDGILLKGEATAALDLVSGA